MELLPEFIGNHPYLFGGLALVLFMLIRAEYDHQTNKANQLTATSAVRLMNNDDKTIIMDVREVADFNKGHIKNAKNFALSTLPGKIEGLNNFKDSEIIIYCNSGNMSGRACRMLSKAGFAKVHNLAGGIHSWQEAKLPTSKS